MTAHMDKRGRVVGVSGPVVTVIPERPAAMFEVARVGTEGLLGEVIRIERSCVRVQVYEDTDGIASGAPVVFEDDLLSVDLGPGLLGGVFDGIGRPLDVLGEAGIFLPRGANPGRRNTAGKYAFEPAAAPGDTLSAGDLLGTARENPTFLHSVMVPSDQPPGRAAWIAPAGGYAPDEPLARLEDGREYTMIQKWRVRVPRPVKRRLPFEIPLLTGQRILDTLFPVPLGGAAVLPGGFGTGKTVTQQSLAKWSSADIIIYIGCGERGNEMTEVLEEFRDLWIP